MIHFNQVSFSYAAKQILKPTSFSIQKEDSIALIGPSGCGKSTLLELILGYKKPATGTIHRKADLSIGVCFQQNDLLPWLNVLSQIKMPMDFKNKPVDPFVIMNQLGLVGLEDRRPSELSGGQQRRVSLARAIVQKPDLLLLDEPFTGVDQLSAEEIYKDLKQLIIYEKLSLVLVTHHIQEAVFLAKKIVILTSSPGCIDAVLENPFFEEKDFGALCFAQLAQKIRTVLSRGSSS